jgi:hypothetical protein
MGALMAGLVGVGVVAVLFHREEFAALCAVGVALCIKFGGI